MRKATVFALTTLILMASYVGIKKNLTKEHPMLKPGPWLNTYFDANYDLSPQHFVEEKIIPNNSSFTFREETGFIEYKKKYALLFNADTVNVKNKEGGTRFRKNIDSMYFALKKAGFNDIIILQRETKNYSKGPATKNNIIQAINEISTKSTIEDLVLIYGTNHGEDNNVLGSKIALDNEVKKDGAWEYITDQELDQQLTKINAKTIITMSVPCKNYFTAKNTTKNNRIGISASGKYKNATGNFSKSFAKALSLSNDVNNDGMLSLKEIFEEACFIDKDTYLKDLTGYRKETPHIFYQNINPSNVIIKKIEH